MNSGIVQRVAVVGLVGAWSILFAPVKVARADAWAELQAEATRFDAALTARRFREAEVAAKKMRAIAERSFQDKPTLLALCNESLAKAYRWQQRYAEAEPLLKQAINIYEKAEPSDPAKLAECLHLLAVVITQQARYPEAESLFKRALALREKNLPPDDPALAETLHDLGIHYFDQRRYADAEPLLRRALAIREKKDDGELSTTLANLAMLYHWQGRYAEAEPMYERALVLREKLGQPTSYILDNLAGLYDLQGKYARAESFYRRAVTLVEQQQGPDSLDLAQTLNNQATFYFDQGRRQEAEALYKRALAIREKRLPGDHPVLARSLDSLARCYANAGRHSEAEPLFKRALAIREKAFGPDNLEVAENLRSLAILHGNQGRIEEAIALAERTLSIQEKHLGSNHHDLALTLMALASWHGGEGCYADAERLAKRALAIDEQAFGLAHADVAQHMANLAGIYQRQKKYDEAEPLFRQALATLEAALGPDHDQVARAEIALARLLFERERAQEAEPLVERAIGILERRQASPVDRINAYTLRADIAWQLGRRAEAIDDLDQALDLAELARGQSSGAEQERAQFFGHFSEEFERMVAWQIELGDASRALAAIERGRARSLLDDINLGGADLQIGRSAAERERLRQREAELKTRVADLERKLAIAVDEAERSRLEAELAQARQNLYDEYRDERATSPVYRNLLSVGGRSPRLSQIQRSLIGDGGLLLVYFLGNKQGFVVAIGAREVQAAELSLDAETARALETDKGPLTAERMSAICSNEKHTGIVELLAQPDTAQKALPKLAALYKALVPKGQRAEIAAGKLNHLVIVPDGPLALVPFEALVVEPGEKPRYLIDAGPPILYAPSATVLYNLAERPKHLSPSERSTVTQTAAQPVLTVAHPVYGRPAAKQPAMGASEQLAARGRYRSAGGTLAELPYTATESAWVADAYKKQHIAVGALREGLATEANVRANVSARRVLHLACHGLTDQAYGNFFGCLALTPGAKAATNPTDDGFLTLPEIYELNLKSCELAILSACQTNYGPQQKGEGVWALSRGFLVAGARRVVASNWLVDDEAAASLISVFCSDLAKAEGKGETPDYAAALHKAKRWVRQQEKWSNPYYWGTFVLVGPN